MAKKKRTKKKRLSRRPEATATDSRSKRDASPPTPTSTPPVNDTDCSTCDRLGANPATDADEKESTPDTTSAASVGTPGPASPAPGREKEDGLEDPLRTNTSVNDGETSEHDLSLLYADDDISLDAAAEATPSAIVGEATRRRRARKDRRKGHWFEVPDKRARSDAAPGQEKQHPSNCTGMFQFALCKHYGLEWREEFSLQRFILSIVKQLDIQTISHTLKRQKGIVGNICGREVLVTLMNRIQYAAKWICCMIISEFWITFSTFDIINPDIRESQILDRTFDMLRSGFAYGLPLMIFKKIISSRPHPAATAAAAAADEDEEEEIDEPKGRVHYCVTDCGDPVSDFLTEKDSLNKNLMSIAIVALVTSLPIPEGIKLSLCNFFLLEKDTLFDYKWTVNIEGTILEFCWTMKGALNINHLDSSTTSGLSSSSIKSFSSGSTAGDGFTLAFIPDTRFTRKFAGLKVGKDGLLKLLHSLLKTLNFSDIHVRTNYPADGEKGKDIITSVLQVTPAKILAQNEVDPNRLIAGPAFKKFKKSAVDFGRRKLKQAIASAAASSSSSSSSSSSDDEKDDDEDLLFEQKRCEMKSFVANLHCFFNIPSDTGKVLLRRYDLKLISIQDISPGDIITRIPRVPEDYVLTDGTQSIMTDKIGRRNVRFVPVKKFHSFVGFGGFAESGSEKEANCVIARVNHEFVLKATKAISADTEIIYESGTPSGIDIITIDNDIDAIKAIIESLRS